MARYLITHSLLSSWLYAMKENPHEDMTTAKDPMEDFFKTLRREPIDVTDAIQNGLDFEALVTDIITGQFQPTFVEGGGVVKTELGDGEVMGHYEYPAWYNAAKAVADELRDAQLQFVAKRTVNIGGDEFLLYGRLDALHAGVITDIKFSKGYDRGKYFDSTQHPMYMFLIPGAYQFTYLVSNGTEVWHETYRRDETPDILPIIRDFLDWLRGHGLYGLYCEYWKAAA